MPIKRILYGMLLRIQFLVYLKDINLFYQIKSLILSFGCIITLLDHEPKTTPVPTRVLSHKDMKNIFDLIHDPEKPINIPLFSIAYFIIQIFFK